jgi:amino acid permease
MIYRELNDRNPKKMKNILIFGTFSAVLIYLLVGLFGYLTFVFDIQSLAIKNIL